MLRSASPWEYSNKPDGSSVHEVLMGSHVKIHLRDVG